MQCSDRIRRIMSDNSLNITDFSSKIGISKRTVESYLQLGRLPGPEFLAALSTHLGVSASWILTGEGSPYNNDHTIEGRAPPDFIPIPRFAVEAAAGDGAAAENEETTGFYAFNKKWLARKGLNPANLAVISVRGDSMEPRLAEGDLILIDRAQRRIADGRAFVVRLGTDLVVKHIQRVGPGAISLISANRLYPPREVAIADLDSDCQQIEIIGRVVASMHEW